MSAYFFQRIAVAKPAFFAKHMRNDLSAFGDAHKTFGFGCKLNAGITVALLFYVIGRGQKSVLRCGHVRTDGNASYNRQKDKPDKKLRPNVPFGDGVFRCFILHKARPPKNGPGRKNNDR